MPHSPRDSSATHLGRTASSVWHIRAGMAWGDTQWAVWVVTTFKSVVQYHLPCRTPVLHCTGLAVVVRPCGSVPLLLPCPCASMLWAHSRCPSLAPQGHLSCHVPVPRRTGPRAVVVPQCHSHLPLPPPPTVALCCCALGHSLCCTTPVVQRHLSYHTPVPQCTKPTAVRPYGSAMSPAGPVPCRRRGTESQGSNLCCTEA